MLKQLIRSGSTDADLEALNLFLGLVALSPDGTILRTNARFLEMFGYQGQNLTGRKCYVLLPSLLDPVNEPGARLAFEKGVPFSGEMRRSKRDGSVIWVDASYAPIRDDAGEVVEIVVLIRDITALQLKAVDEGGQIAAINTSQSVIQFALDGTIIEANPLFLQTMGYEREEIVGRHHRIFMDPIDAESAEYRAFWETLQAGGHSSGEYRRLDRNGRPIWLRATYSPIFDAEGRAFKIVKYAVDVTDEKLRQADHEGQIAAIHKSQCVVTFAMDGTIEDANDIFLQAVGYRLEEVAGRHHRIFVDPSHAHSLEYELFWSDIAAGRHRGGEFKRLGKGGIELWLQATYNPVLDQEGRPFKVVKYATVITREKLRQADHQGQIAAIHKSQAVVSFALDGTILDANDNFLELTGYRLSEVRMRHHRMFVSAEEQAGDAYKEFWQSLAMGEYRSGEFKRVGRGGQEIWLQASYNPIFDMNGRPFKVVKNAVDVTSEKLRQSDYEGQIAAIRKSQCVVAFAMDGTILEANENFLLAVGYELEELVGRHHSLLVEPSFAECDEYRLFWERLREGEFISGKFRRTGKDGREVWIQASYNPILDLNGKPFKVVKIATDITADVALAADLTKAQREVLHDGLTGLPNRSGLSGFMRAALGSPDARLSILYLDLDHFKPINDTFGHAVGDHVLRELARRLRTALKDNQIVARVGGDEFVVAAPDLSVDEAAALAKRLIAVVKDPIYCGKNSLTVGLSIGIAQAPSDSQEETELLRQADVALYRSKGRQRGIHSFFSDATGEQPEDGRYLAHEMQFGIKAAQFELVYQPRFTAEDRVLEGVEARIEWNHPERGRLKPEVFLPLAEESGLIVPLGDWALRTACDAAAGWPLLTIALPVSPIQVLSGDLVGTVTSALQESGLPASRLELRMSHGPARIDPDRIRGCLSALRGLGIKVVVEARLLGKDLTESRNLWPVDHVLIDGESRADLERQGHSSIADIQTLETALGIDVDCASSREGLDDLLTLRLNRQSRLEAFLSAEPRSATAMSSLALKLNP